MVQRSWIACVLGSNQICRPMMRPLQLETFLHSCLSQNARRLSTHGAFKHGLDREGREKISTRDEKKNDWKRCVKRVNVDTRLSVHCGHCARWIYGQWRIYEYRFTIQHPRKILQYIKWVEKLKAGPKVTAMSWSDTNIPPRWHGCTVHNIKRRMPTWQQQGDTSGEYKI